MNNITVIGWMGNDDVKDWMEASIGGMGGFFSRGMRWPDYYDIHTDIGKVYISALREAILKRNLKYNGREHQTLHDGIPVFGDGTIGDFSFRAWGDLMAAIWSEKENKDYNYMDFYC